MMHCAKTLASAVLFCFAIPAFCQDLVAVAPKNAKVEYEDARVRVVRLKIAPNETLPMHDRPARVVIALTSNDVRLTLPDGSTRTVQVPAANIAWSGPGKRSVKNLNTPLENIVVEMKSATDTAKAVTRPPDAGDARALIEPHHHWLFENQYVRVYDVRIPPGEVTTFHTHAYDTVAVELSDGLNSAQTQGGPWERPEHSNAGEVTFLADANKPRTHRVRNDGKAEYHVVLVQLK
jgi:quercetin dioxygenase-like cupin family protein